MGNEIMMEKIREETLEDLEFGTDYDDFDEEMVELIVGFSDIVDSSIEF